MRVAMTRPMMVLSMMTRPMMTMMKTPGARMAIVGLALAVGVSACGGGAREASGPCATASPAPPVRLAAALPAGVTAFERGTISAEPFADASLIMLDVSGRPRPALAESWHTDDGRTWTFTLRAGLRAHNGEPLTAWRIRELLTAGLTRTRYQYVVRDIQGIEAPAPRTLVIRLARPNNALPELLMSTRLATYAQQPGWAAGPFRVVRDTPDEITYEPFPDVWSGPPTVGGLRIRLFSSPRAAWAAFLRNEADVFYEVPPDAVPLLEQNRDVQLFRTDPRFTYILAFQQRHPILRDVRVRRALNLAIDREAIARRFFGVYAAPGVGPFAPDYWAARGLGAPWPYDPAAARALLKEATGGRTQPIELVCLTTNQFQLYADIAATLEAQLQLAHVRLRVVTLPITELYPRLERGDFDLFALPMAVGYSSLAPYFFWHSPQPGGRTTYAAADAALDALIAAQSDEETRAAAGAVVEVMHRDPPAVFVMPIPRMRAVRRTWRVPDAEPDIRRTLPYWTLAETPPCR